MPMPKSEQKNPKKLITIFESERIYIKRLLLTKKEFVDLLSDGKTIKKLNLNQTSKQDIINGMLNASAAMELEYGTGKNKKIVSSPKDLIPYVEYAFDHDDQVITYYLDEGAATTFICSSLDAKLYNGL